MAIQYLWQHINEALKIYSDVYNVVYSSIVVQIVSYWKQGMPVFSFIVELVGRLTPIW